MKIELKSGNNLIQGYCEPQFQKVLDTFVDNFALRDELGASVCINIGGVNKVDLWGGFTQASKKPNRGSTASLEESLKESPEEREAQRWQADTLSVVFSCTKAATALCLHLLIDQGKVDLHAKVSEYWPEFAKNGKEAVTVEMLLNHSVGLPALREPVKEGGFCDWDYMIQRIEDEAPFWPPGTRNGYQMTTFGWTVGGLVRQVSGVSLGQFFRTHIAEPLGLDFWIGLPDEEHHRVAPMQQWAAKKKEKLSPFTHKLLTDKHSIQYLALLNSGRHKTNSPEAHRAEYGAGGGITNARHLAGMYNPLANDGCHEGKQLFSKDAIAKMSAVSVATMEDATLLMPSRFSLGFMRSMDNRHRETGHMESCIMGKDAFGHAGAGGSIGFADPDARLAFGYTMNRMGAGILLNERGQSLIDASYQCLAYRSNQAGMWIR